MPFPTPRSLIYSPVPGYEESLRQDSSMPMIFLRGSYAPERY